jgi:hypothetical protein
MLLSRQSLKLGENKRALFQTTCARFGFRRFGALAAACALNAPPGTAALSDQQAREIAEGALVALNEGDYEAFIEHFSEKVQAAMSPESFEQLRATVQETSGDYLSLSGPKLIKTSSPDAVGYVYDCKFEKEEVVVTNYYLVDGDKVEGFFLNSPNLRKVSQ